MWLEQWFKSLIYFSDSSGLSGFSHLDRGINRARVSCPDFRQKLKMWWKGRIFCLERRREDVGIRRTLLQITCHVGGGLKISECIPEENACFFW